MFETNYGMSMGSIDRDGGKEKDCMSIHIEKGGRKRI